MKRSVMSLPSLPVLTRCCGCVPLETGCLILCYTSILLCAINIVYGSWNLPRHREREPEDNLISMSLVMFSSLSVIGNLFAIAGMRMKRFGYLQITVLFNTVFTVCLFLVAIVTCLFSPMFKPFISQPGNIAMVIILFIVGAAFYAYYLIVLNSMYKRLRSMYDDSAIPI